MMVIVNGLDVTGWDEEDIEALREHDEKIYLAEDEVEDEESVSHLRFNHLLPY